MPDPVPSPKWGLIDVLRWKLVPGRFGGGPPFIRAFKNQWVRHNRVTIRAAAKAHAIPPELLAGTAWIEVGGDPTFIDRLAFEVRALNWSGPEFVDRHLTVTKHPAQTSFGAVSMQLRTAAETLGMDPARTSDADLRALADSLEKDVYNLNLVARHLRDLIRVDTPWADTRRPTPEMVRRAGARYNRGAHLPLDRILMNMSYGNFLVKLWPRMTVLLDG